MMQVAIKHARRLEYVTVGWNAVEGVVSIAAGAAASSTALVGFGIDSFIESTSGSVMLWRLHGVDHARKEALALKLVGWSLLLLAAYVLFDAASTLLTRAAPERSFVGIALACVSLVAMPVLAARKRRVATLIGSHAMTADSMQTSICAYLSAVLLGGLLLNATLHWWWADPVAALIMVPIIAKEGWEAVHGKACSDCCTDPAGGDAC
ncbi:MAG TPA: cation transporter [Longimicrobiales bacterium]